ncbi:DUF4291 domain-containing protein [Massilia sp. SR12]
MEFENYKQQLAAWPHEGKHILAQFDESSVVVYQAYRTSIAQYAVEHQRFGGDFSFTRMSWIKPNFLWMMYRSGWAGKSDQEHILAVRLKRAFFDRILEHAVASSFPASHMTDREQWQAAVSTSDARLQWDPDHDPFGTTVPRRAMQLGLRGNALDEYATSAIISVEDITQFVHDQRPNVVGDCNRLMLPTERLYTPSAKAANNIGLDTQS